MSAWNNGAYQPWEMLLPINRNVYPYGAEGIAFPFVNDYTWIFGLAVVVAFATAMGIGANDVANSFATSVGSKSLTLVQALVIAGIFEFTGAVTLGATVTDTVRGGIVSASDFETTADVLMVGMLCALISVSLWLAIATAFSLPVSTTHSVVGAVLGFGLCVPWADINWKKLVEIVISWFLSPALSSACAAILYASSRTFILRSANSFNRTLNSFAAIVLFTVWVNVSFIIIKGGSAYKWTEKLGGYGPAIGVALACAAAVALPVQFLLVPRMRRQLENLAEPDASAALEIESGGSTGENPEVPTAEVIKSVVAVGGAAKSMTWAQKKQELIHGDMDSDERVAAIHENAEKYDHRTELAFGYVQVFTACAMAFAHGANDVANAIGPLASITEIYLSGGNVASKAPVPIWILCLGGAGLVVGLALFGHLVIRALGIKLIKVTPARGACIELATALVVVIGSILGLPLSTTHTMVGASIGVGLVDGARKSINGKLIGKIMLGWVATILVAGAVSAAVFSLIVYGPSLSRPIAPQNCMNAYGVTIGEAQLIGANMTIIVGSPLGTGSFPVIKL